MTQAATGVAVKRYYKRAEQWISSHRVWTMAGVVLLCAIMMIARRPDIIFHAQFWAEDGAVWYTDAYHNSLLTVIFRPYPDYLAVPQRIIAEASTWVPMHRAPLFLNLAALCTQLLPVILLMSGRLKRIVPSNLLAIAACLLYVSVLNAAEVYGVFANLQWLLGPAAFLVLVAKPSPKKAWKIFDAAVLVALGLSGPTIFILALVAFFVWRKTRGKQQRRNFMLVSVLAAVQLFMLLFVSTYQRVGGHPAMDFFTFVQIVAGQIFTGGILGEKNMDMLYQQPWQLYTVFWAGLALVAYVIIKGPQWLKLLNTFAILTIASMMLTLKPVEGFDVWKGLTNPTAGQRYWYFAILATLANVLWLAFAARSRLAKVVGAFLLVLLLFFGIPQGWKIENRKILDFPYFVQQFETMPRGVPYIFPINPPGWKMILYKN